MVTILKHPVYYRIGTLLGNKQAANWFITMKCGSSQNLQKSFPNETLEPKDDDGEVQTTVIKTQNIHAKRLYARK